MTATHCLTQTATVKIKSWRLRLRFLFTGTLVLALHEHINDEGCEVISAGIDQPRDPACFTLVLQ